MLHKYFNFRHGVRAGGKSLRIFAVWILEIVHQSSAKQLVDLNKNSAWTLGVFTMDLFSNKQNYSSTTIIKCQQAIIACWMVFNYLLIKYKSIGMSIRALIWVINVAWRFLICYILRNFLRTHNIDNSRMRRTCFFQFSFRYNIKNTTRTDFFNII